jgi:hypothetical protein
MSPVFTGCQETSRHLVRHNSGNSAYGSSPRNRQRNNAMTAATKSLAQLGYISEAVSSLQFTTRVEAGSNTSTVTLRVVGSDEKGSLKSETVKYGRKSQGSRTRERLRWQGPAAHTEDRPVLSSERATHGIKNVTVRRIPYSERKQNLVVSPGWVLYTKTDWQTDRRS